MAQGNCLKLSRRRKATVPLRRKTTVSLPPREQLPRRHKATMSRRFAEKPLCRCHPMDSHVAEKPPCHCRFVKSPPRHRCPGRKPLCYRRFAEKLPCRVAVASLPCRRSAVMCVTDQRALGHYLVLFNEKLNKTCLREKVYEI